jgi:hypothetical protein
VLALVLLLAVLVAGCGGGGQRQDAGAPSGTWRVAVEQWKFPKRQYLGTPTQFKLSIRNTDRREIPQLIVTIGGLSTRVVQPNAASTIRPVWLPPKEPNYANVTPYNSPLARSYNLGPVAPGELKSFSVELTPLRRGSHTVTYKLSPDLFGDNRAVNSADGGPASDSRVIAIDPTPQFDKSFFAD